MKWINVRDEIPEVASLQYVGSNLFNYRRFVICPAGTVDYRSTHWMPLPDAPEDNSDDSTQPKPEISFTVLNDYVCPNCGRKSDGTV